MSIRVDMYRNAVAFSFATILTLSSCSTLTSFGYKKEKLHVDKPVALKSEISGKSSSLENLAIGLGKGCFDNDATLDGEVVSFAYSHSRADVLNYLYHNKASWDIETKIDSQERNVLMKTSSELKIMFKRSSCKMKKIGFFYDVFIPIDSYYPIKVHEAPTGEK